ncbi:hypothetical protein Avbf_15245 [Armadillidium vulgare]|nr:hypothetical protein Avbf_15245 [Armadillidium vulgare]
MAEIEHFCFPDDKDHPKFNQVTNTKLQLYSACNQMDGEAPKWMTIGEAVRGVRIIVSSFVFGASLI